MDIATCSEEMIDAYIGTSKCYDVYSTNEKLTHCIGTNKAISYKEFGKIFFFTY